MKKECSGLMMSVLDSGTKDQDTSLDGIDVFKERASEDRTL